MDARHCDRTREKLNVSPVTRIPRTTSPTRLSPQSHLHARLGRHLTDSTLSSASSTSVSSCRISKPSSRRGSPFRARSSKLDLERLERDKDDFRGFFVLFWVAMGFYTLLTMVNNLQTTGILFGLGTFRLMTSNLLGLVRDDLMIVASLFSAFVLNWLMKMHVFRHPLVRAVLQHTVQSVFFFGWLSWIWHRDLPWVQSGTLTLHVIAMLFKIHSYNQYNGELNERYWADRRVRAEYKLLESVADPTAATVTSRLEEVKAELAELEYPRTQSIRWSYVCEKLAATLGSIMLMYITVEHYILPVLHNMRNMTFAGLLAQLFFPFMICYLMTFYIIFECVCNGFAEITRFADRNFYGLWWNSSSFDQFAREWNKPVHEFLLRHVYLESIQNYKVSKKNATLLTFLFSSCLHELAMIIVSRKFRMYLFLLQMFQLPLIWLGRLPWSRRHPVAGNAFFWFGMFAGPPLLAISYCFEYYYYL
ncbi:Sterol O-acyltransferase 2 (Sterol-ester synthase 2) [Blastocladiella emersonii ATCC 22665]|nr:Sterol O-acyltransferase 2 (Sterol-ester synthase 2) [Blastocladiella emersonii ATCC 22665]